MKINSNSQQARTVMKYFTVVPKDKQDRIFEVVFQWVKVSHRVSFNGYFHLRKKKGKHVSNCKCLENGNTLQRMFQQLKCQRGRDNLRPCSLSFFGACETETRILECQNLLTEIVQCVAVVQQAVCWLNRRKAQVRHQNDL